MGPIEPISRVQGAKRELYPQPYPVNSKNKKKKDWSSHQYIIEKMENPKSSPSWYQNIFQEVYPRLFSLVATPFWEIPRALLFSPYMSGFTNFKNENSWGNLWQVFKMASKVIATPLEVIPVTLKGISICLFGPSLVKNKEIAQMVAKVNDISLHGHLESEDQRVREQKALMKREGFQRTYDDVDLND